MGYQREFQWFRISKRRLKGLFLMNIKGDIKDWEYLCKDLED